MEYNYVGDLPEEYVCQICMKLLNEPQATDCCGQHFCSTCLDRWFRRQGKKHCPHCRSENFNHFLNKEKKRKINELKVYCSNREKGCGLTLKLEELERHLSTDNPNGCGYIEIECPNECPQSVLRKDMEDHCKNTCQRRKVKCIYCKKVGPYSYITGTHRLCGHVPNCHEYPVQCPKECGIRELKRKNLKKHKLVCPLEPVECPFRQAGCKEEVVRKDLDNHIQSGNQEHLLKLMTAHAELEKKYDNLKKDHKVLKSTFASIAPKLKGIQKTVKDKAVKTSLKEIQTTLNQVLKMTEEDDQLVFRYLCDTWGWVSSTFTVCNDTTMYLRTNCPDEELDEEYFGTLSLILESGNLDGCYEIDVETEIEDNSSETAPSTYDPNLKLCDKCSPLPTHIKASRLQGYEIGRVSLLETSSDDLCIITLTLKAHDCPHHAVIET